MSVPAAWRRRWCVMSVKQTHPFFSFFPALPLSKTLRLGDWSIGKPSPDVAWRSPRFKELALKHLDAFAKEGFKDGALMWHQDRGFDGSMPEPAIWTAIKASMCFAALDANDQLLDDPNAVHYITTSENAELYTQPIDEEKAYISIQEGGALKRIHSAGWKIGEESASLPDATVAVSQPVIASQHLATAVFDALLDTAKPLNRRIAVALEWHRFALSNPAVISWQQRLISLKTGFEALSGESKTHLCGQFLRKLFEETTSLHRDVLPWAGILWSPLERTDLARTWMHGTTPRPVVRSELEDWFAALGEARNEIIHEGTLSTGVYEAPPERPLSRYAGPLFWKADRLLRETVKALLGVEILLCGRLHDLKEAEKFGELFRSLIENAKQERARPEELAKTPAVTRDESLDEEVDVETAAPEPDDDESSDSNDREDEDEPVAAFAANAVRSLETLLGTLRCERANMIRLEKIVGQPSPTIEGADANARAARGRWAASFGKRSILINKEEHDILKAAGAEFPLPRYWTRCD